jgi:hypothetical protein
VAGVRPAHELLARQVCHAGGGDEVRAGPRPVNEGGVGPPQQLAGIVGERGGGGERCAHEGGPLRGVQAVPDDIADDEDRRLLRSLGDEVEVPR